MAGIEDGELFSNLAEIEAIGASSATFQSFTTCIDSDGAMRGTQYTLLSASGDQIPLTAIGNMSGTCQTLTLEGSPIEKIRASYAQSQSGVSAIKYYKGGISKTYGTLLSSYNEWTFTE